MTAPDEFTPPPSPELSAPIPREQLERARRQLCRQIAAQLLNAMVMRGMEPEDVDRKLEDKPGTAQRRLTMLSAGRGGGIGLRILADFCFALDCVPSVQLVPRRTMEAP